MHIVTVLVWPLLLSASVSLGAATTQADTRVEVLDHRQVFVDQFFLAQSRGVELVTHAPRKTGESNVRPDRPWERGGLGPYSSVLKDGDKYWMWYHAMDSLLWDSSPVAGAICVATSLDGIHWEKPNLGLIDYEGSRDNNIVIGHGAAGTQLGQDGCMVFVDPGAPADERFRMVCRFGRPAKKMTDTQKAEHQDAVNILSSADGIHWRPTHSGAITARAEERGHHLDSQNVIFWDDQRHEYVCYVRRNLRNGASQGRSVARGASRTIDGFPAVQDMPVVLSPDKLDRPANVTLVDYYSSAAIKYPWADNAYFMFPQAYFHYTHELPEFTKQVPTNAGALDTQFAASRDGLTWERFDRRPFIPLGASDDFDCHSARILYGLVPDRAGREMYMYYRGSDWLHGWDRDERNKKLLTQAGLGAKDITIISRVVLRRDGFVSVRAGVAGGEFVTPPLRFTGSRLQVNVDTSATGSLAIELQDESGQPLQGHRLADSDLIHTCNQINRIVSWRGVNDVSGLADRPVRLRFVMKSLDLYAFQFIAKAAGG